MKIDTGTRAKEQEWVRMVFEAYFPEFLQPKYEKSYKAYKQQ